jgi:hypothetical protein
MDHNNLFFMKKVCLFLLLAMMPFVFGTCGDDEELSLTSIEFEEDDVVIEIGEEYELSIFPIPDKVDLPKCSFSSDDKSVVTVSKSTGIIKGISAGEATITAKTSDGKFFATCDVTVRSEGSSTKLYREPYLKFGNSAADIKKYETRQIYEEDSEKITFLGENDDVNNVMYLLKSKKMNAAGVIFNKTTSISTRVMAFLKERYDYKGKDSDNDDIFLSSDGKLVIYITSIDSGNLLVGYQEYTSSKSPSLRSSAEFGEQEKETFKLFKSVAFTK